MKHKVKASLETAARVTVMTVPEMRDVEPAATTLMARAPQIAHEVPAQLPASRGRRHNLVRRPPCWKHNRLSLCHQECIIDFGTAFVTHLKCRRSPTTKTSNITAQTSCRPCLVVVASDPHGCTSLRDRKAAERTRRLKQPPRTMPTLYWQRSFDFTCSFPTPLMKLMETMAWAILHSHSVGANHAMTTLRSQLRLPRLSQDHGGVVFARSPRRIQMFVWFPVVWPQWRHLSPVLCSWLTGLDTRNSTRSLDGATSACHEGSNASPMSLSAFSRVTYIH